MKFEAFELTEYGMFDSCVKFPKDIVTQVRDVVEYEIELYIEDQDGVSYIDGEEMILRKGTLICVKPGMKRYSRLPFKCLYIHLKTTDTLLCRLLDRLQPCNIIEDFTALTFLFRRLMSLDCEAFPEERLLIQSTVMELVYRVLQETGSSQRTAGSAHKHKMKIVAQYVRDHLQSNLCLKALAAVADLSPSYFHKIFTDHFGCSPSDFVINCRISAAKVYLMEGELSMEAIADKCGFSCHSYFNHCFKQKTGQTPLQYRRESLSKLEV